MGAAIALGHQGWGVEQMFQGCALSSAASKNLLWGLDLTRGHNSSPLPYTACREPEQGEVPCLWCQLPAALCLCWG